MTRSLPTALIAFVGAMAILVGCSWSATDDTSTSSPSSEDDRSQDGFPSPVGRFEPPSHPFGAKWVWDDFDQVEPFLTELDGGATYVEVVLCDVQQSPGEFDWSGPDSQISRARAIGFESLVKLRVGRCWATPGEPKHQRGYDVTESAMPEDMSVYTDFVDQAVRRYTNLDVTQFAIENEVNSPYFWDGTTEEYETLARAAAETIHAAAPDTRVVDGSVSSAGTGFAVAEGLLSQGRADEAVELYQSYYERRFGTREGSASIDEVASPAELRSELSRPGPARATSFMRTIDGLVAEGVFQARQVHYYETWQALPTTLAYIRGNTPDAVPMEMWELGIWDDDRTVTEDQRTDEVVRSTVIALAAGVERVLWLPLMDNPNGRLGATLYGLVGPSGEQRGSSNSYALMAQAASDDADIAPLTNDDLMGVTFDSNPATMVAWATGDEIELASIPGAAGTTLDSRTRLAALGPAATTIGSQPVLVTTSGSVSVFEEVTR